MSYSSSKEYSWWAVDNDELACEITYSYESFYTLTSNYCFSFCIDSMTELVKLKSELRQDTNENSSFYLIYSLVIAGVGL